VPNLLDDSRPRRAAIGAGVVAAVLIAGMAWHVVALRAATLDAIERRFANVAASASRMIEVWLARRNADVAELAGALRERPNDSIGPAARDAVERREHYKGRLMVDAVGRVVVATNDLRPEAAERRRRARQQRTIWSSVVRSGGGSARSPSPSRKTLPMKPAPRAPRGSSCSAPVWTARSSRASAAPPGSPPQRCR
jgi:hypothetical protein